MNKMEINRLRHEALVEAVMAMPYRAVISREEISRLVQEPVGTRKFYGLIGKARKSLEVQGRILKTLNSQGYQLLHPDDCAEAAISLYKQGGRAISRGARILSYARVDEMSPDALKRYQEGYERARAIHAGLSGAVVELNLLSRPHPLSISTGRI